MDKIKLEKDVLEKLWNGELNVSEECRLHWDKYKKELRELDQIHRELAKALEGQEEGEELMERYENQRSYLSELENREAFKRGFGIAVSMLMEALEQ